MDILGRSRRILSHPVTAWVFLAGSLLLTALAWYISNRSVQLRLQDRFTLRTDEIAVAIRDRIASYESVLRGGAGLLTSTSQIDRARWRTYVDSLRLKDSFPGIRGVGFSQVLTRAELLEHTASVRKEGFPTYQVWPQGDRDSYSSIIFLEPFDWRNQRAFGYDMMTEPIRRRAMDLARDSGEPTTSGAVTLVQETDEAVQKGFLIYVPVYRSGSDTTTVLGRTGAIRGFVYAPFRMGDLMQGILGQSVDREPDIDFHVFDGDAVDEAALMYDSGRLAHSELDQDLKRDVHITMPGQHPWTIRFMARRTFSSDGGSTQPLLVAIGGIVIDLLLFAGMADLANRRKRDRAMRQKLQVELELKTADLRRSEERLLVVLHGVGDGVWDWHVPSKTVAYSDGWKAMLGFRPEEIGTSLDEWSKRAHPDDLGSAMAAVEAHLAGKTPAYHNEHRMRHRDGRWIWILDRGIVIERDAAGAPLRVVGTHSDITERKLHENEQLLGLGRLETMVGERTAHLEQANRDLARRDRDLRIFASVIEQSPMGIVLANAEGVVTYANGAAMQMLPGCHEAIQRSDLFIAMLQAAQDGPAIEQAARSTLTGSQQWSQQVEIIIPGASPRWLDLLVVPIAGTDGQRIGFASLIRDVSRIKQLEIEHQMRSIDLIQSAKMAALGTLTAGIGHEIGNPANFISINAPLLEGFWREAIPVLDAHAAAHPDFRIGKQPWPDARDLVPDLFEGISAGVTRIRRLIGDLRTFSLPDTGAQQALDVNQAVEAAISLTRHALERATRSLIVSLGPDLPLVNGSIQRLEQALVNIILNACQALSSAEQGITIATRRSDGRIRIVITDEGIGIPDGDLPRLGEPFHTTKRERGGTGLGLPIVRRIVADHGGELVIESRLGHGTAVTIILPVPAPSGSQP